MSEKDIANILNAKHRFLIRYVKPSYINQGEPKEEIFQLREDRSPPEEYISFYHSTKESIYEKINDVKSILNKRNFNISKTSGFLSLNALDAIEEINITREIISFKAESYPHYGMYYLSEDTIDIQEAKTILLYHCELYLNQDLELENNSKKLI
ncbi:MAG: hypothetical protein U9N49_12910 [Campylobacterota bacterium]|nr:hypothetical protein [Campylobacterota bacterium]